MAGFRENRITIMDLFPSISAWSKRQSKTKQRSVLFRMFQQSSISLQLYQILSK